MATTKKRGLINLLATEMFTYSTERSAAIKSIRVGVAYRLAQIILLFYIIGLLDNFKRVVTFNFIIIYLHFKRWELIRNKGYQTFDTVSSIVTTKVKGQGYVPVNSTLDKKKIIDELPFYENLFMLHPHMDYYMLDTADYIIPPNEFNSIFIMTNFLKTDQVRGNCDEVKT